MFEEAIKVGVSEVSVIKIKNGRHPVIEELLTIDKEKRNSINFEEFLLNRFGDTLYRLYFKPYNEKTSKKEEI